MTDAVPTGTVALGPRPRRHGLWHDATRRLAHNRVAVAAAATLAAITIACLVGPLLSPHAVDDVFWDHILSPPDPSAGLWLGTDANGRDLLVRILMGGRISLAVGAAASLVSLVIGVCYGAIAGTCGGPIDTVMMRLVDVLYSLPFLFFVILLTVLFGHHIVLIFVAIGAVEWLDMARIVRGQALALQRREFVEAARACGVGGMTLILRHIIPNLLGPVVVYTTLTVPRVILLESFLSFLGLGVQEPLTSWGALVADGATALEAAPWTLVFPSLFLGVTLLAFNILGDALRDALDPQDHP